MSLCCLFLTCDLIPFPLLSLAEMSHPILLCTNVCIGCQCGKRACRSPISVVFKAYFGYFQSIIPKATEQKSPQKFVQMAAPGPWPTPQTRISKGFSEVPLKFWEFGIYL